MSTRYICFYPTDKTFTYDNNGSLTKTTFGAKVTNYTYDYENRLTRVIASPPEGQGEAIYKYDYLGRRISKEVGSSKLEARRYIYDGDNIVAEYDGLGALVARYVYGPNIDEPIRMETLAPIRQMCYYYFDGLGSVTDLSNTPGKQIEHYYYDPFGKTKIYDAQGIKLTDSAYNNRYRFTAREWDAETNLYYYRARMYDPKLGRFLQADPVGYSADINLYRYCGNNGVNWVDPRGLEGSAKKGKVGHVAIHSPIKITGIPLVIVTWNNGRYNLCQEFLDWYFSNFGGNMPEGSFASFDREEVIRKANEYYEMMYGKMPWGDMLRGLKMGGKALFGRYNEMLSNTLRCYDALDAECRSQTGKSLYDLSQNGDQ